MGATLIHLGHAGYNSHWDRSSKYGYFLYSVQLYQPTENRIRSLFPQVRTWARPQKKCRGAMLSWIRGLASEPCRRVLHGQFSKKHGQFNHARPRLDYASAMRTPGPPAECRRVHWGVLTPHHLRPVHGFLDPVSGKTLWWKQHAIFSHFRSKQKEMNSSTSFHLSMKCMALTTLIVEETLAWYDV